MKINTNINTCKQNRISKNNRKEIEIIKKPR